MLSIQKVKELLKDKDIDDKQAEQIRDCFYYLAELVFEKWQKDKLNSQLNYPQILTLTAKEKSV